MDRFIGATDYTWWFIAGDDRSRRSCENFFVMSCISMYVRFTKADNRTWIKNEKSFLNGAK